jgi:hypothetical protein
MANGYVFHVGGQTNIGLFLGAASISKFHSVMT